jgi:uncharacterized RDD family membrane protein YckC
MKGKPALARSEAQEHATPPPGSLAAKAAARVARRFAQAPSYNEMLATEARAAVEAAEAASIAAQQAHAKAQIVLAGIEAASNAEAAAEPVPKSDLAPFWEPQAAEVVPFAPVIRETQRREAPTRQAPASEAATQGNAAAEPFAIQWEQDLPPRSSAPEMMRATRGTISTHVTGLPHGTGPVQETSLIEAASEEWNRTESAQAQSQEIAMIEPALPIFGNVIEFPRQIVATRKVRPRLAEGPLTSAGTNVQLSIFEVDPGAISVEPEVESPRAAEQTAEWTLSDWSAMRLAREPEQEYPLLEEPSPRPTPAPEIELATFSRRVLASVVDATLVTGACLAAAALAANNASELPGLRAVEIGSLAALIVAGAAYKLLFFTLARTTPGMKYARLALCTFDGGIPTRAQRLARLAALLLSILPVGLGFAWAIFDDQNLTWHDRLSRTYLRVS